MGTCYGWLGREQRATWVVLLGECGDSHWQGRAVVEVDVGV